MDKTTHEVRLHQWHEIIQAQLASGQNKRNWCRKNGISEKQFFYWQRRVRKELYDKQQLSIAATGSAAMSTGFVEVPITRGTAASASESFHPEAVIAVGSVTVGVSRDIPEALLMSIGKMIRHAL